MRGVGHSYAGVAQGERRRAGEGLFLGLRLSSCTLGFAWLNKRVTSLRLQVGERTLSVVCADVLNPPEYAHFLETLGGMLDSVPTGNSIIQLGDFNVGNDRVTGRGVVGRNGLTDLNLCGVQLLDFCPHPSLFITNTMFQHKVVNQCSWHHGGLGCSSLLVGTN